MTTRGRRTPSLRPGRPRRRGPGWSTARRCSSSPSDGSRHLCGRTGGVVRRRPPGSRRAPRPGPPPGNARRAAATPPGPEGVERTFAGLHGLRRLRIRAEGHVAVVRRAAGPWSEPSRSRPGHVRPSGAGASSGPPRGRPAARRQSGVAADAPPPQQRDTRMKTCVCGRTGQQPPNPCGQLRARRSTRQLKHSVTNYRAEARELSPKQFSRHRDGRRRTGHRLIRVCRASAPTRASAPVPTSASVPRELITR